jgi:16S rRNA (cytosine1402-N4)-methyltransferase
LSLRGEAWHRPVFVEEVVALIAPRRGGLYVDGTVGDGGHTRELLARSAPDGRVVGFDRDASALERARAALLEDGAVTAGEVAQAMGAVEAAGLLANGAVRLVLCHDNYDQMMGAFGERGGDERADGVLLDLGASTLQLLTGERGFSFRADGPLDMRMDESADAPTAHALIESIDERGLEHILRELGEERFARRIAKSILRARDEGRLTTTRELADAASRALPPKARFGAIHPATRTFQALRIAVNAELEHLSAFLASCVEVLRPGGTLVVLTYHSLEDRLVKHAFRGHAREKSVVDLTKKPLRPSPDEVEGNPRARSAKLRAVRRAA